MFTCFTFRIPSLISLVVSVDVKHHVYLLYIQNPVPNKPCGFCGRYNTAYLYLLYIQNPMRDARSESAREPSIALYKSNQ